MIGDRWGVSQDEIARRYPCDDLVAVPVLQAWRGVDVAAPARSVWPWVAQVRLAPYSYDWIDNLGRRSPRELAGLPEPRAGESFTRVGGRPRGRILSVDPGRQLTAVILGAFMSYVLVPQEDGSTRLLLKVALATGRWAAPAISVGDLVMARRQLLNLKRLAEQSRDLAVRGWTARRGGAGHDLRDHENRPAGETALGSADAVQGEVARRQLRRSDRLQNLPVSRDVPGWLDLRHPG